MEYNKSIDSAGLRQDTNMVHTCEIFSSTNNSIFFLIDLKKDDLTTKQWVGYNPFVDPERWKGVADWISFLSQNVRMETLVEDAQKARATKELIEVQG